MVGEDGILKELELAGFQYLGGPVCMSSMWALCLLHFPWIQGKLAAFK